jgi:hypothetical protein
MSDLRHGMRIIFVKLTIFMGLAIAALVCGCHKHSLTVEQQKFIDQTDHYLTTNALAMDVEARRDEMARNIMLTEMTNGIVGVRSVVFSMVDTSNADTNKWTGFVKVDFINHFGGVDRTNLFYKFHVWTNAPINLVLCSPVPYEGLPKK